LQKSDETLGVSEVSPTKFILHKTKLSNQSCSSNFEGYNIWLYYFPSSERSKKEKSKQYQAATHLHHYELLSW
jgi:hypothetical protein